MAQDSDTTRIEPGRATAADPYPTAELPHQDAAIGPGHDTGHDDTDHDDTGTGWPAGTGGPTVPDGPGGTPPTGTGPVVIRTGGGFLRGLFYLMATLATVVVIVLGLTVAGVLPHLHNPFGKQTVDRSQPALLKSIQDMSRYVAADGNFQVIVDVQNDTKYVPDFLVNDRTLFVAAGDVEAYVDFAALSKGAVTESADHRTATIKLPAPQLGKVSIDTGKSYVFAEQKGVLNHLGDVFDKDPNKLQQLYQLGSQKITDAARSSGLQQRAEDNTTKMLEGFLRSLGYTTVTVTYTNP